ncbi:MAG: sulfatase-like hydrolase/transferase [Planctomycetota bacterium]
MATDRPNESSRPLRRSRARALVAGALVGGFVAAVAGAIEGALTYSGSPLDFGAPMRELARVDLSYGLAGALFGALAGVLAPRLSARTLGGATLAALLVFVSLNWTQSWLPADQGLGDPRSAAALALGVLVALAAGFGLARAPLGDTLLLALGFGALIAAHVSLLFTGANDARSSGSAAVTSAPADAPNVIVLLIDTLRADHLSSYGYSRPTSPTIDALAASGARFEAAYAPAPWTRPSVTSLMTSLYPSSHDVVSEWSKLPDDVPTLAELMKSRGYRTGAFSANRQVSPMFGLGRGFDTFWNSKLPTLLAQTSMGGWRKLLRNHVLSKLLANAHVDDAHGGWSLRATDAATVNREVEGWLDGNASTDPFFLYVHYLDPHHPYSAPEDLLNTEKLDRLELHQVVDIPVKRRPYPLTVFDEPDPSDLSGIQALYDAEIRYVDREIGRLLATLRARGLLENTYVVVTSDHGEEFHDHGQWLHGNSLFEELIRVPLVIAGPEIAARVVDAPVSLVDLLPTIADWTGESAPFPVQGANLANLLRGGEADGERTIFFERNEEPSLRGIRTRDHKLIELAHEGGPTWMEYDLARDPAEQTNLASDRSPTDALRRMLDRASEDARRLLRSRSEYVELRGGTRETLKALGYVGD